MKFSRPLTPIMLSPQYRKGYLKSNKPNSTKTVIQRKSTTLRLSVNKAVLLQNNIFLHNNSLTPADMRQHYLWELPFLVSKIYYFEVRCSFVAIKILLCRRQEMKQGCRLARLFDKSIRDFYVRNQYFLMNTQPIKPSFLLLKI